MPNWLDKLIKSLKDRRFNGRLVLNFHKGDLTTKFEEHRVGKAEE